MIKLAYWKYHLSSHEAEQTEAVSKKLRDRLGVHCNQPDERLGRTKLKQ